MWFLVSVREIPQNEGRSSFYRLEYEDALTLFDNRIIPFRADFPRGSEPRTYINTIATKALEQVYDITLGLLAGPNRILEPEFTSKAAVTAVAPVITKEIAWKRSLSVLKQIARTSRDQGTPIYFDLVARNVGGSPKLQFTTYSGQRGADNSQQIISSQDPNFVLTEFSYSYKVVNAGYVGGSGRGLNRLVAENTFPGTQPLERVEQFKSAQSSNQNLLEDEVASLINNTAGRVVLAGRLLGRLADTYNFGDLVTLQHRNFTILSEISSISYTLDNQYLSRTVVTRST